MWLKYVKRSLIGLSLMAGFASFASSSFAAPVDFDIDGSSSIIYNVGTPTTPTDTVTITVSDGGVYDVVVAFANPPVTDVTLNDGSSDVATGTLDGFGYSFRYAFVTGTTYTLSTGLTGSNPSYQIRLSAVPLPAAAWMFLSILFGGAWVKRRGARSKGGVVATA